MVTNGRADIPRVMHQMEYGNTLWSSMDKKDAMSEMGIAQPFSRDRNRSNVLAVKSAIKNQMTPSEGCPNGVIGPYTSAQNMESALVMTMSHPAPFVIAIKTLHSVMASSVKAMGITNRRRYRAIVSLAVSQSV